MVIQELIGWDLLYKLIEKDIKTEADVIVAIVHWFLIKEGEFRCLGIGDQVRFSIFVLFFRRNNVISIFSDVFAASRFRKRRKFGTSA